MAGGEVFTELHKKPGSVFSVLKVQIFPFVLQILSSDTAILPALSHLTTAWCLCRYPYTICSQQNHLMVSEAVSPCGDMVPASTAQCCLHWKAQERRFQKSVLFFLRLFALLAAFIPIAWLPERGICQSLQLLLSATCGVVLLYRSQSRALYSPSSSYGLDRSCAAAGDGERSAVWYPRTLVGPALRDSLRSLT